MPSLNCETLGRPSLWSSRTLSRRWASPTEGSSWSWAGSARSERDPRCSRTQRSGARTWGCQMSEVRSGTAFEGLRCIRCGYEVDAGRYFEGCPKCTEGDWAANLEAVYDLNAARRAWEDRAGRGVWRYAGLMPVRDPRAIVTMGEGATPLIPVEVP